MSTDFLTETEVDQEVSGAHQVALVAVMMLLGAAAGWFGPKIHRSLSEDKAAAALSAFGAVVRYDYQRNDEGKFLPDAEPPGPEWLRALVGNYYFAHVTEVDLSLTFLKPPYLHPKDLDQFTSARMEKLAKFSDTEMMYVAQFRELKNLQLADSQVTGVGLTHLRGLRNLETLWLDGTRIEDGGLMYVAHLTTLKEFHLSRTLVTDDGLEHLARLVNLKQLDLSATNISEAGIFAIKKILPDCVVNTVEETVEDEL